MKPRSRQSSADVGERLYFRISGIDNVNEVIHA
jgi:hypothetical protein